MFKKKIKNFMCNLGKLFTFSFGFLGLFGLIALLGGWSKDDNGNFVSDALVNLPDYIEVSYDSVNNRYYKDYTFEQIEVNGSLYFYGYFTNVNDYYGVEFYNNNNYIGSITSEDSVYNGDIYPYREFFISGGFYFNTIRFFSDYFESDTSSVSYYEDCTLALASDIPLANYEPYGAIYYNQDNFNLVAKSNLIYWIMNNANAYMFNINPHNSNNSSYDINYFYNNRGDALFNKQITLSPLDNIYYLENFSDEINANNSFENDNPSQQYQVLFVLANPCDTTLVFNLFDGTYDFGITALYNNGLIKNFENEKISNYYVHVPYDIENNNPIIAFKVNFYWEDYISIQLMIKSDNETIQTYYDRGYYKAYDEYNSLYQRTLIDLKNANSNISSLTKRIDDLNEQLNNTIGWKPFIFTMADTPFRVVSNVLGFEVFGVNLYKVLVGLITTLAILWLIRKLRK